MKFKDQVRVTGIILAVLAAATVVFVLTTLLTTLIYRTFNLQLASLLTQIINWVLGLIFCGTLLNLFAHFNRTQRWNVLLHLFGPIFEAMAQIAKGDFNVKLDNTNGDNPLFNEMTKRVNSMAVELSQLETMRQEFISNVSHEIQSPLTSIRGFAQALQNDSLTFADRNHYLAIIETESVRLSKLADNLLKLASLESAQVKFEPKPYRLDKQIRELLLLCEPQWQDKSLQVDAALAEMTIQADEELLSQVWLNLIHNSIKFTPDGGTICVALQQAEAQVEFSIRDTGIGISEADQAHIFERFYKADKSRQRAKGGNGLGLSIAQKIVEMHHGTISVTSQPGTGTIFTVSLPIA